MSELAALFARSFVGYARWFWGEVRAPSLHNSFWLLVLASAGVAGLEAVRPWRRLQPLLRAQLALDLFYLFLNFFGFGLLGYVALADVSASLTRRGLAALGLPSLQLVDASGLPEPVQWLVLLVLRDFIEYFIHRLLHRVPALWRVHQVHHSVREMSFAAHLRFHPLETVIYRSLEFLPLAMIGFSVRDFFVVYAFALLVGHLNHANLRIPLGPLRYLLNSAEMHILHHAKDGPRARGVNFGLTLSTWDYLFGTAWDPRIERRHTELGFPDVEHFPSTFFGQLRWPFRRRAR